MSRAAGVLLPVSSLPSGHGIGDMGRAAYRFVDMLSRANVRYWQILPLNPLGYGNSPYQPYSSFAGDLLYISLDALWKDGLLPRRPARFRPFAARVDYEAVRLRKETVLREAFARFVPSEAYERFVSMEWTRPYAVFMALKRHNPEKDWTSWPEAERDWPREQALDLTRYEQEIRFELFAQYQFHSQWMNLKRYANERNVELIGDIPIYVGLDSEDVWSGRENFLLNEDGTPSVVAGVPPDYFSALGQRWGNPIYDWAHMQADGFSFWKKRLEYSATLYDVIRIDHFRAFDTYWEIPAENPTAVEGVWQEAPGYALFDEVLAALPGLRIIAEDLGMLRDEVHMLRDHYDFPGMKVLEFTFAPGAPPEEGQENRVVYTGTHDNQTVRGWFEAMPEEWQAQALKTLSAAGYAKRSVSQRFVRLALADRADLAVLPVQDLLGLDDRARINTPGTVGSPNWEWKLRSLFSVRPALSRFAKAIQETGRA